ncbi:hypothetical protein A2851_02370 [Candidatus Kaiserbacteria bacterium RIFCSPHIGHO2_01_FULL_53_29]|uniref:Capsule polysaccharide biosynthesis protein n=1 Tax=Candidatus Kaiserbacteria bacterium RIFCSPHIGHO2_01_FULL_53_29 TaxID=1798480 RepID=A0A1F6CX09_9BACT|nr:MAG: hypothetical protein A2851_02370 [Candidatus Kaiserbacteria bacterium RIFCSPHIGHO2_01_FULL_53_29]
MNPVRNRVRASAPEGPVGRAISNGVKGCFILQRRFAYIGHELAKFLKEKGAVDEFCGYVQVRDGYRFLKNQPDIRYTELILDEEIQKQYKSEKLDTEYLAKLEDEYGTLWKYINVDRVVRYGQLVREYPHDSSSYTHEEMLRMVQVYAKGIGAFLDEQKPDFVYGYIFGSLGTLLLYDMAKKRGIPVFTTVVPSTEDLVTVSQVYDRVTFVERLLKERMHTPLEKIPNYAEARAFLEKFRNRPFVYTKVVVSREKPGRSGQFSFLKPRKLLWTLYYNLVLTFVEWCRDGERRRDFTTVNPFLHLYDLLKRKARNLIGLDDLYDKFDTSKPYTFFPLQYEPEVTLLLWAPEESDQVQTVARIARSLPVGMLLYVKEHPGMVPFRPRAFYRRLRKIPNVRLINPSISSFDLIKYCALVTVITGTPGWEAALLQKPVITFGTVYYNALSFIGKYKTPEDLPELIKKQLNVTTDDEELLRFIAALYEDSAALDLMYLWEVETDEEKRRAGFKRFADVLALKIRLISTSN